MSEAGFSNPSSTEGRCNLHKETFEKFLTYRRRMARMAAVQVLYLQDVLQRIDAEYDIPRGLFGLEIHQDVARLCANVQYFYGNNLSQHGASYDPNSHLRRKDEKRIDERYLFDIVTATIRNLKRIDDTIAKYLKHNWTINGLDFVVRAILRCGVAEVLFNVKTDVPILTCEYTNIASLFFGGKETGFVNGIVDRVSKESRVY